MPLHVPIPAVALEGDYSTWTQKWVSAVVDVAPGPLIGGVITEGKAVVLFNEARAVVDLADGSFTVETFAWAEGYACWGSKSVLGKYHVVFENRDSPKFRIYKDGVLLGTVEVADRSWYGFLISSDGKYIIAWDYDEYKLYCYEGS